MRERIAKQTAKIPSNEGISIKIEDVKPKKINALQAWLQS